MNVDNCNIITFPAELRVSSSEELSNFGNNLKLNNRTISFSSLSHIKTYKARQCPVYNELFSQKITYQDHERSHRKYNQDSHNCNICGKSFAVPARLTRHYRTHTGEKPYQCEYCTKSFSVKENLSVHRRIHTKERPYKCDVCQSAFEHSGKLHRHMRIHTGERPHRCSLCNKTFIQSGQLVIHMRTHTGEKPYACKSCGKGFTCSKQLKVHSRTHTGEKPYKCEICGKSFGYNHVLKLHQVAHYGKKCYKCTLCQKTFHAKKLMESHLTTHPESSWIHYTPKFVDPDLEFIKNTEDTSPNYNIPIISDIKEKSKIDTIGSKIIERNIDELDSVQNNYHTNACNLKHSSMSKIGTKNEIDSRFRIQSQMIDDHHFMKNSNTSTSGNCTAISEQYSLKYRTQIDENKHNIDSEKALIRIKDRGAIEETKNDEDLRAIYPKNWSSTDSSTYSSVIDSMISDSGKNACLPPRKRCKMILESMKEEDIELLSSKRCSSVIKFAKVDS